MKKITRFLTISFLLFFINIGKIFAYDYVVKTPQSLKQLANNHYYKVRNLYNSVDEYVEKLKEWNQHLDQYDQIPQATQLYLVYPYTPFVSGAKYTEKLKLGYDRGKSHYFSMDLGLSFFQRHLNQSTDDREFILESTQQSPISLDSSLFIAPAKKNYFYDINFRLTYLMPTDTNTEEEFPSTYEYGLSTSILHKVPQLPNLTLRFGPSYQRLVTFNLEEVSAGLPVEMRNYDIGYISIGLNYKYQIFGLYNNFKTSYSRSVWSQSDDNESLSVNSKAILIENVIQRESIRYALFYERETNRLSSLDSKLERFGVGLRFLIF